MAELFIDYSGLREPEAQRIRDILDPNREGAIDVYDAYDYSGNDYPFRCCDFDCLGSWDEDSENDEPCCCRNCVGEENALNFDDDSLQSREEISENQDTCCCNCGEEETVLVFDDDCFEYSECDELYEHFPSIDCMCPTCFYDDDSFESSDDTSWESDASGE